MKAEAEKEDRDMKLEGKETQEGWEETRIMFVEEGEIEKTLYS